MLISLAVIAKLICVFGFAYAKRLFYHDEAQMSVLAKILQILLASILLILLPSTLLNLFLETSSYSEARLKFAMHYSND